MHGDHTAALRVGHGQNGGFDDAVHSVENRLHFPRRDARQANADRPPIGTALDTLIERFGTKAVAEVTGRTRRLVVRSDGRQKLESRTARSNLVEADAFMRAEKSILVFSDAGGTGLYL